MEIDMNDICKKLQTGERYAKNDALAQLQLLCDNNGMSAETLMAYFDDCYLHLLKCYSDRFESVRDNAVQTVTAFIKRLPPIDFHLLNIVASLVERMGQQETLEESEEIRLLYVNQLSVLIREHVNTGNTESLKTCYEDIVQVLIKAVRDAYPTVQREGCACIVTLAKPAQTLEFDCWSEKLAIPLYGMLNHKHSLARISAVEALAHLAIHLTAKHEAFSRLIMEVSPLLMDSMPMVRREVGKLGILMLLELRDRYSYFDRLIPLVLCCLKDDSPEVINYIRPMWLKCGKLYYEENEEELNKQDIADLMPENYPSNVERPYIGCRALVQRSCRLLKLVMRESSDWKENVRLHSLKLLYQFVLHAEAKITAYFFEIYSDIARTCCDNESQVRSEAAKVCDLMGRLFCYDDWIGHAFEGLEKHTRLGYLKCFYYMFTASLGGSFDDIMRAAKLLETSDFSQTLTTEFQEYVLKLLQTLLNKSDKLNDISSEDLANLDACIYTATIKVMALIISVEKNNDLMERGELILNHIFIRQNLSIAGLHEKYFPRSLVYLDSLDAELEANSEPVLLLNGLLMIANFRASYLEPLLEKIKLVWQYCANDAQVTTFTTISISMLCWNVTIGVDLEQSILLLRKLVAEIVEPHLKWAAGSAAEAMRCMATATLSSISMGAPKEALHVLPTLGQYIPSLLEDRNVSTRHYAVKAMCNFGPLKVDELKPLAYAVLQRLDDPSGDIRVMAATALPQIKPKFTDEEYEHELWDTFMKRAFDLLFLHYQGPELRLKEAIEKTLCELRSNYTKIFDERYQQAVTHGCNLTELELKMQQLSLTDKSKGEKVPTSDNI